MLAANLIKRLTTQQKVSFFSEGGRNLQGRTEQFMREFERP